MAQIIQRTKFLPNAGILQPAIKQKAHIIGFIGSEAQVKASISANVAVTSSTAMFTFESNSKNSLNTQQS